MSKSFNNDDLDYERIQAVVFDLGGVFLEGGPSEVAQFGMRYGMDSHVWNELRRELFIDGDDWDRVERGEAPLDAFAETLRRRMADHGFQVTLEQARNFMRPPGSGDGSPLRPEIVEVCGRLHRVMPTALLTNNVAEWRDLWRSRIDTARLFDVVVDSSAVRMRKPEPRIYALTEEKLGIDGAHLLFVDDIGSNLKGARQRGWQTLKYEDTHDVLSVLNRVAQGRAARR
jgi:putative hydrolase of the HAD superfamily